MDSKPTEIAREGLEAWRKGDFETIEEILDPNVEWHATERGGVGLPRTRRCNPDAA